MKNLTKQSLAAKLIIGLSLLAVFLFLVTPTVFLNYSEEVVVSWGWDAVLGLNPLEFANENKPLIPAEFNWVLYTTLIAHAVLGVITFLIGKKSKGFYIFATIIFVILAIVYFTTASTWIYSTYRPGFTGLHGTPILGVGPWFAGLASAVAAISCIVENRMAK